MFSKLGVEGVLEGGFVGLIRLFTGSRVEAFSVLTEHLANINISTALNIRLYAKDKNMRTYKEIYQQAWRGRT